MTRFLSGIARGLAIVAVLGATVLAVVGWPVDTPLSGSASVDPQTEGAATDGESSDAADATPPPGSDIEAFLANILPSASGEGLPAAQRVVLSRDPFQPVVPTDDGGSTGGNGSGDGTDGTDGGGDGTDGTDGDGDDADACLGDEAEAVCDGVVITLDGFTDDGAALVTVNGSTFEVAEGDEFATSFRVLSINEPCATLLYGDEAFSICTGATVLK